MQVGSVTGEMVEVAVMAEVTKAEAAKRGIFSAVIEAG
jgi:hypothetical protein